MPAKHSFPSLAAGEALAVGSSVAEFRILRVLGSGGFGIVYLAHDDSLRRQVALKEYLPATWARRGPDGQVTVRSSSFSEIFAVGLSSFVNEARLLARFDHPSLVKVHRFWEANGTVYMVMPYYEGVSLRQVRESMSVAPDEAWLRRLLDGLLGALQVMHDASVFHRDVAPDNILVLRSGVPVLLDFGAARHVLLEQTQVITAILKPSYAPIEQYAGASEVRQGPWTDIYATAATLHYCLTGKAPPTSAARAVQDTLRPLHRRADIGALASGSAYDNQWLEALDWGLAVMPQRRPQSIAVWRQALAGRLPVPAPVSSIGPIGAAPAGSPAEEQFATTEQHPPMRPAETVAGADTQVLPTQVDARDAAGANASHGARSTRAFWRRVTVRPLVTTSLASVALASGLWSLLANDPRPTSADAALSAATVAAARSNRADPAPQPVQALSTPTVVALGGQPHPAPQPVQPVSTATVVALGSYADPVPQAVQPAPIADVVARDPAPVPAAKARPVVARYRPARSVAPANAKPPEPSSPRQLCSQPAWLSRLSCMRTACAEPNWAQHPSCTSWLEFVQ